MLKQATVNVKDGNTDIVSSTISKVYDTYMDRIKNGGNVRDLKVETYSPATNKFSYQGFKIFKPYKGSKKVMKLMLSMGKTEDGKDLNYEVIVSQLAKILVSISGKPTCVTVGTIPTLRMGRVSVGFVVKENDKSMVKFCSLLDYEDPFDTISKVGTFSMVNPVVTVVRKNKGRPKKSLDKKDGMEYTPDTFDLMQADPLDRASYFVCDGLIVK